MGIAHKFLPYAPVEEGCSVAVIGPGKDKSDINFFVKSRANVYAFDLVPNNSPGCTFIQKDFVLASRNFVGKFDIVWACHVLEHQRNVGLFLDAIHLCLKEEGTLCVSVPPAKNNIVGGHLTVWNMGLLMYNLVLSGFCVRNGKFRKDGYNIFGMVSKSNIPLPKNLTYDKGDLEALSAHWPESYRLIQNTNGNIESCNWSL